MGPFAPHNVTLTFGPSPSHFAESSPPNHVSGVLQQSLPEIASHKHKFFSPTSLHGHSWPFPCLMPRCLGIKESFSPLPGPQKRHFLAEHLVAPYRAILRYYRCDTPCRATLFRGGQHSPKMVRYPPWYLVSHRHVSAIPPFAAYRAVLLRCPIKTSTKSFCDTIATSIARYEKYRCWASKAEPPFRGLFGFAPESSPHFCGIRSTQKNPPGNFPQNPPNVIQQKSWKHLCRLTQLRRNCWHAWFGNPPAWHRGLPGPSGPEPQKSPKRVWKGVPGPLAPGSPRVPKECAPESEKSLRFRTPGRTLWGLWGSPGPAGQAPKHPFGLFSDSCGVLGPKGPGALCAGRGGS